MIKRALVTGGTSGLGYEIAKRLSEKDIDVIILGRNEDKLNKALQGLKDLNPRVDGYSVDVSNEEQVKSFMSTCPQVDYLFNVAGKGVFGPIETITRKDIDDVLASNLIGMILVTSYLLRQNQGPLKIYNIMSTAARKGKAGESIYCAAKFGAKGFTDALQATYKGSDVHVTGVYPGGMMTEFWAGQDRDVSTFMNASHVAEQIVKFIDESSTYTSEIVIERP